MLAVLLAVTMLAGTVFAEGTAARANAAGNGNETAMWAGAGNETSVGPLSEQEREEVRTRIENAEETYTRAKERYQEAVEEWRATRGAFANASLNASGIVIEKAKEYVQKVIERMISHIEVLEKRVDSSTMLSEDDKTLMLAELEQDVVELEGLKDGLETAETKAEVRDIAIKAKEKWSEARAVIKKYAGLLLISNFDNMLDRFENLLQKLGERADKLEQKGYDVSGIREAITNSEQVVAEAQAELDLARESFMAIDSMKDADKLFREGHAHIVQARVMLVDALKELKDAFKEVRLMNTTGEQPQEEATE